MTYLAHHQRSETEVHDQATLSIANSDPEGLPAPFQAMERTAGGRMLPSRHGKGDGRQRATERINPHMEKTGDDM